MSRLPAVVFAVLLAVLSALCLACLPPGTGGTSGTEEPAFPAPRVGGTAETDAVANAPARCGQPPHAWLRSPDLRRTTTPRSPR